jgi:site-specific recombinase XerD
MTDLNAYSLDLSSEEMNVLQVAIDHMVEHLADLHIEHPSDRSVHRRLDAVNRLKQWCNREVSNAKVT